MKTVLFNCNFQKNGKQNRRNKNPHYKITKIIFNDLKEKREYIIWYNRDAANKKEETYTHNGRKMCDNHLNQKRHTYTLNMIHIYLLIEF